MSRTITATILATLALVACTPKPPAGALNTVDAQGIAVGEPNGSSVPQTDTGVGILKARASSYVPFTQAAYDAAKASGQPTMLYFYATWCPICARQEPIIVDLFTAGEIADYGIAALRVNFNDPDTDADERALADRFGVSYQHTFVLLDAQGTVVARINGHQTKEQLKAALGKINK